MQTITGENIEYQEAYTTKKTANSIIFVTIEIQRGPPHGCSHGGCSKRYWMGYLVIATSECNIAWRVDYNVIYKDKHHMEQ